MQSISLGNIVRRKLGNSALSKKIKSLENIYRDKLFTVLIQDFHMEACS